MANLVEERKVVESGKFSEWYQDVLQKSELADYAPTRGCMVIRPLAYSIWENIQQHLDQKLKAAGVENAYFPLFIPESFIAKEKKHVEGFSPELAVVTHAGGEQLEEPLVVRPTSETIIYHMFSKWIKSHRDLPLKINQWCNVVRWEKRTRPFLRTTEFLWQEGHTAHASEAEGLATAREHLNIYVELLRDLLAIPVIAGPKPESEKFAGAKTTLTMEAMMPDGKALQIGTSHLLDISFPKSFEVCFQNDQGELQSPWCTSWGMTTRVVGALIMIHGDLETGLVLPPAVAPKQVSVVPIRKTSDDKAKFDQFLNKILTTLKNQGLRTILLDEDSSPGNRFYVSEKKGIPLRIEVGMRDVLAGHVMVAPRLQIDEDKKKKVLIDDLGQFATEFMKNFQAFLLDRAESFLTNNIYAVNDFVEFEEKLEKSPGFYKVFWCESQKCEEKAKTLQSTFRVVLERFDQNESIQCFICKSKATCKVIVAKSY